MSNCTGLVNSYPQLSQMKPRLEKRAGCPLYEVAAECQVGENMEGGTEAGRGFSGREGAGEGEMAVAPINDRNAPVRHTKLHVAKFQFPSLAGAGEFESAAEFGMGAFCAGEVVVEEPKVGPAVLEGDHDSTIADRGPTSLHALRLV
jgi:hypothetical protein